MHLLHYTFAASAIAFACCACLISVLKRLFRSECINGHDVGPDGSALRPTITSLLVFVALAFGITAACLVKPLSKRCWTVVAAVCSKWKPLYFIVVSAQKIILRAIAIPYAIGSISERGVTCHLPAHYASQFHSATLMWDCSVLLFGVLTICADVVADATPALRRCAQCLLALCLCIDAAGSYVWGNEMAGLVSLSVSRFEFVLDNQITSCITSQAVLALHFAFVGWRSRHGRSWYYASLRFELDQRGRLLLSQLSQQLVTRNLEDRPATSSASAMAPASDTGASPNSLQNKPAERSSSNALSRLRRRLLQFQQRHVAQCRVFVIPCVNAKDGAGGEADFALERPAFNLKLLRPLQRVAEAHLKVYCCSIFLFLALPSLACAVFLRPQVRGIPTFALNSVMCIAFMGFLSSKRYNLDRAAVTQVALSFRFGIFVVLLSQWIALNARRAYLVLNENETSIYNTSNTSPWTVFSVVALALLFTFCLLLDCCPHLPAATQVFATVRARSVPGLPVAALTFTAGWMVDDFHVLGLYGGSSRVRR
jgi:hypothetical protein